MGHAARGERPCAAGSIAADALWRLRSGNFVVAAAATLDCAVAIATAATPAATVTASVTATTITTAAITAVTITATITAESSSSGTNSAACARYASSTRIAPSC